MVMICGVKPIPAEPDSHSPSKTITVCIVQKPTGAEKTKLSSDYRSWKNPPLLGVILIDLTISEGERNLKLSKN
jgi:hypothetical protein